MGDFSKLSWSRDMTGKVDNIHWNDRRSHSSVFTRPFSNEPVRNFILLLITRERLIGPSNTKFVQQFEINELYVCTQFRGNRSRDFGFRTRKPPRKFGVKSGLSQKRLKYCKKYFIWLYVSRYPFIPTNPLLAAMRFISFFFPFFFLFST